MRFDDWLRKPSYEVECRLNSIRARLLKLGDEDATTVAAIPDMSATLHAKGREKAAIYPMLKSAVANILAAAMLKGRATEGPLFAWTLVVKVLLDKVAELQGQVDKLLGYQTRRETPVASTRPGWRFRACPNCAAANISAYHTMDECRGMGNAYSGTCKDCGKGRHRRTQCPEQNRQESKP